MLGSLCPGSQAPTSPRSPPGGGGFSDVPGLDAGSWEQLGGHPSPGVHPLGPWLVSVNRHRQAAAQPPLPLLHPPAPPASLRTAACPPAGPGRPCMVPFTEHMRGLERVLSGAHDDPAEVAVTPPGRGGSCSPGGAVRAQGPTAPTCFEPGQLCRGGDGAYDPSGHPSLYPRDEATGLFLATSP